MGIRGGRKKREYGMRKKNKTGKKKEEREKCERREAIMDKTAEELTMIMGMRG